MDKLTYEEHAEAIASALALGIDVESEDPNLVDAVPHLTGTQIAWVAAWLASEGIGKL